MATLKSIKKRIGSVKNTQKVTRAMQMIAAARLRRAQMAAVHARAYTEHARAIALRIAERAGATSHPYLVPVQNVKRVELLVLTSDRGLCGGFNENLLREMERQWKDYAARGVEVHCTMIGRKGRDFLKARHRVAREQFVGFFDPLQTTRVRELVGALSQRFLNGEVDAVVLVYNKFRSAMSQVITATTVLPMAAPPTETAASIAVDYLYEPSRDAVLKGLLEQAVFAQIYQACLESQAGELGARMVAMDSATKNAREMIDALTMLYNRARQASITKELLDIVNGSESIKH